MNDETKDELMKRTREWLQSCVNAATRSGVPEEADLEAFILAHVDGEPERIAAAREEQREACATAAAEWAREAALARGEPGNLFDAVMTTPLTSRPLADRIAELEKELSKAEWRVAELEDDVADTRILLEPHFGQETYQLPLAKTTADLIAEWQRREAAEEKAEEGVRYWTDLAQAEARDAAALRTRVAELEAQWGEAVAALRGLMSVVDGGESGVAQVVDASNSARAVLAKYPEGR